jgi:hypothetical protein
MPRDRQASLLTLLSVAIIIGILPGAYASDADRPSDDAAEWAYRPMQKPAVPTVQARERVRNPIDAFLLAKLEARGLTFAPPADPATLIRRVTFDLTGLPPTPEALARFLADPSPAAYDRYVDTLLASPQYGERMALYWLDLVRFAESDGFRADDPRPHAWRYRDYVIEAFNSDKPYDRFIAEQLAGDELYPDDPKAIVATGFLRHYPDEFNAVNLEQRRYEILTDITDTTATVFMGVTLGCARCHDHKYDPITQDDYFRIQAFFAGYRPVEVPICSPEEKAQYEAKLRQWEEQTQQLREQISQIEQTVLRELTKRRRMRFPPEYAAMLDIPPEKRTPLQKQIVQMILPQLKVPPAEMTRAMKQADRERWEQMNAQLHKYDQLKPQAPATAMAMSEFGPEAPPTHLLRRGEWKLKSYEVLPGFLSAIDDREAEVKPPAHGQTSGRRSALAQWLTNPEHPLTARVMVNRLWQQHFVRGIVGTSGDFGVQGDRPTHPELLDWLAREFIAKGWSIKAMHRLMVTSAAYMQASRPSPEALKVDPSNRLLSWMPRRRLEGEAVRDTMLAITGKLNLKMGGPSIYPELPAELKVNAKTWPLTSDTQERNRRSVYIALKRNLRYPLFAAFDAPDANEVCTRRYNTTTAPQALMLLNDQLIRDHAKALAGRVLAECNDDSERLIDRLFTLALSRLPSDAERQDVREFLASHTGILAKRAVNTLELPTPPRPGSPAQQAAVVDLCHAILNLNEFVYVD